MSGTRATQVRDRYLLLGAVLFLTLGGLVMIYSASSASDFLHLKDSAYHLKKQLQYIVAGLVLMVICARIEPGRLRRMGFWVLGAADIGLAFVLLMGVGKWGATRWIDVGFINLQPSELAKLGVVMTVAGLLADRKLRPRPVMEDVKALAWILVPVVVMVMLQPDMGTTMTILVAVFFLLVLGGVEWRHIAWLVAGLAAVVPAFIVARPYRAARWLAFVDPWADPRGGGYQIIQALLAFGSGGPLGVGLGMSRQKFFYLPAAHTDFVFAIIGEELGLLGTLAVVAAFGIIAWAGVRIAMSARDQYAKYLAGGLVVTVVAQAVMNMAAVTGLMPVTGIPLPLVSYGGSSMLFTLASVGLILSVARNASGRARSRSKVAQSSVEESGIASPVEWRRNRRPRLSSIDGGRPTARRRA